MLGLSAIVWIALATSTPEPSIAHVSLAAIEDFEIPGTVDSIAVICRDADGTELGRGATQPGVRLLSIPKAPGCDRISCEGPGLVCSETPLTQGETQLQVRPATLVEARVTSGQAEKGPGSLLIQAWPSKAVAPQPFVARATADEYGTIAAPLPRGTWDLRFAAPGWAPAYRWGVDIQTEPVNLGALDFRRGSSVSGFLRPDDAEILVTLAEVSLLRPTSMDGSDLPHRDRFLTASRLSSRVDANGFFQIAGIPPGVYVLQTHAPGAVATTVDDIAVEPNTELLLGEILLTRALTLYVEVAPPTTPTGKPWRLTTRTTQARQLEPAVVHTDELGQAAIHDLDPGTYQLVVRDELDSEVEVVDVEVLGTTTERIVLDIVRVEGEVRLDDEPLAAKVEVHAGHRGISVLRSNGDGELFGWSRRPLDRQLVVEVTAEDLPFHRRLVVTDPDIEEDVWHLDLDLKVGRLIGRVRNDRGESVSGARVVAFPTALPAGARIKSTDREGRFSFDVSPEEHSVQATHPEHGSSTEVLANVPAGGSTPELELVVQRRRAVTGRVLGRSGRAISNARVAATSVGGEAASFDSSMTDLEGNFEIDVAERAVRVSLVVVAPGQPLWTGCVEAQPGQSVLLTVEEGAGGSLAIDFLQDLARAPATNGQFVLVNDQGGQVGLASLLQAGSWLPNRTPVAERTREHFASLAPGSWAAMWAPHGVDTAAMACSRAWPLDLDWVDVAPGGEAQTTFDYRPYQPRRQ